MRIRDKKISKNIAQMWLQDIFEEDLIYKVDCEVEGINCLSDLFSSTDR